MLGGAWFNECFGDTDNCDVDHIVDTAISIASRHLGIRDTPTRVIPNILKVSIFTHDSYAKLNASYKPVYTIEQSSSKRRTNVFKIHMLIARRLLDVCSMFASIHPASSTTYGN